MNNFFRIPCRTLSQLPKCVVLGIDTRLNFTALSLVKCDSNLNLVRPFHVTSSRSEKESKGRLRRERFLLDPVRNRTKQETVETSIRYLQSEAYKECYGDEPVWKQYRRNHKGLIPPEKTRKACIRNGVIFTGNPCPICRDEYLIVDYSNVELLKQFISEYTGEIISYQKTGVCQKQHANILVAYLKAKDLGLITFDVPFREYDYSEYEIL